MTVVNLAKRLARPLLALVLLALPAWLLWSNPEPLHRLLEVKPQTLAALFALTFVNQALVAARFALVVQHAATGARVPVMTWFRLVVVGNFLNLFVPQLGNLYRALTLKREHKVPYTSTASGLLSFVWLDLLIGFLVALLVIALVDPALQLAALPALAFVGAAFLVVLVAPFVAAAIVRAIHIRHALATRLQERVNVLLATTTSVLRRPLLILGFSVINVAAAAVQVVALWLAFRTLGAPVDLLTMLLFQVFLKLTNQIVITPGNLGLAELTYAILARGAECTPEQGVAASLFLRSIGMVLSITFGVALGGLPMLFGARPSPADLTRDAPPPPAPPPAPQPAPPASSSPSSSTPVT